MSSNIEGEAYPPVPCESIVFRAASKKAMFNEDTDTMTTQAFLRYRGHDDDGISLFMGQVDSCEKAAAQLTKTYGVSSLHTGHVRATRVNEMSLTVTQDEPRHGVIGGLPFVEDNPAVAEKFATLLVELSRTCWRRPRRT